ncbi:uncharacterized protein LOC105629652 [Jatropha curcas]|uniref:uncharacterized protein LOC105629652 n=1 Tax=Jatropha curcas TaxID=180498 RepID=UPI0005FB072F|nr:uncharacterized protein LOC105629652 [Jatropha curcas]
MHAHWATYFGAFHYVIKHKAGTCNTAADVLSKRAALLIIIKQEIVGFEFLKDLYASDEDFTDVWAKIETKQPTDDFLVHDRYLFKENRLCIPRPSLRENLIQEVHGGGLSGHLGHDKTIADLEAHFYWP